MASNAVLPCYHFASLFESLLTLQQDAPEMHGAFNIISEASIKAALCNSMSYGCCLAYQSGLLALAAGAAAVYAHRASGARHAYEAGGTPCLCAYVQDMQARLLFQKSCCPGPPGGPAVPVCKA